MVRGLKKLSEMSEKEIIERQQQSDNKEFYLALVGKFLHAIDQGAFALSRATGYKVVRKQRKNGSVLVCGFPVDRLDQVRQRLRDAGGIIEQINDKLYRFSGLDGTPDVTMVQEQQQAPPPTQARVAASVVMAPPQNLIRLKEALLGFNLSISTPMDAMNLIAKLQQQLRQEDIAEKVQGADSNRNAPGIACESPSGQGLAE